MTAGMAKLWLLVYSQDPRHSRGLDLALEGQNTDNTPKGVPKRSANCITVSGNP